MVVYEKEFYRRNRAWGNYTTWSLRLDTAAGTLRVRIFRTAKDGDEFEEVLPDAFAKSGNWHEHRLFKTALESLVTSTGLSSAKRPARLKVNLNANRT